MRISVFSIENKAKIDRLSISSSLDFDLKFIRKDYVPVDFFDKLNVYPYCIDHVSGDIILVECDSFGNKYVPFLYDYLYRYSRVVYSISINDFIEVSERFSYDNRVLFVHSVGRCGSTLLARSLGEIAGVAVFSEPDIFTQVALLGRSDRDSGIVFSPIYRGLVKFFARDCGGAVAFKFRGASCEHADYLVQALPSANSIFLYRNALDVARSYARVSRRSLKSWILNEDERRAWSMLVPLLGRRAAPIDGYCLMATIWAGPVLRYLQCQRKGVWLGSLDYSDLVGSPSNVMNSLVGLMGKEGAPKISWDKVFRTHSQGGSHLDPARLTRVSELEAELSSPYFSNKIQSILYDIDHRLNCDMSMPNKFPNWGRDSG